MNRFLSIVLAIAFFLVSCSPYVSTPTATPTIQKTRVFSPSPTPSLIPTATPVQTCKVTTGVPGGNLNLRAGKGTSYAVIRVLSEGETLTVIAEDAWLEVEAKGNHGWVNPRYCK